MNNILQLNYNYIPAFSPIYDDDRPYYFLWGGRGGGKSFFIGDYLIDKSYTEKGVYLNTREKQNTIADSNYALFKGRIEQNKRPSFYITNNNIVNQRTGVNFIFHGLSNMTKDNIKSMFNIKRAWCEESQTLTKESIEMLYPTVRDNNSHLYFTFNRNKEDDPVFNFYKTFNCRGEKLKTKIDGKYYYWWLYRSPEAIGININFDGNPYFTKKLEKDRERDKDTLPEFEYNHIWQGAPRHITEATILKNIIVEDFEIDTSRQPKFGLDLGFNDPNAVIQCYIYDNELYICREFYRGNLDPDQLRAEFLSTSWMLGQHIIYDSSQPAMGKMLNATGRFTLSASRKNIGQPAKEGLYKYYMALYLMQFKAIHIHKTNCPNAEKEFKSWSWKQDKTGKILDIPQDGNDHTVDAAIYALERDATIWYKNFIKR